MRAIPYIQDVVGAAVHLAQRGLVGLEQGAHRVQVQALTQSEASQRAQPLEAVLEQLPSDEVGVTYLQPQRRQVRHVVHSGEDAAWLVPDVVEAQRQVEAAQSGASPPQYLADDAAGLLGGWHDQLQRAYLPDSKLTYLLIR